MPDDKKQTDSRFEIELTKLLFKPEEVADMLSFTVQTIRDLVEEGKLRAHCHNGVRKKPLRITTESIMEFYTEHQIPPEAWSL
jgi:excisionase family DNA binding protein